MELWGWLLIGIAVLVAINTVADVWRKGELNWAGLGKGMMHVFDSILETFNQFTKRFMDLFSDLLEPRFVLALIAVAGFFFVVWLVFDKLTEAPPVSELLAVLGLVLSPAMTALGFWFGREVGRNGARTNGNGERPPTPPA